MDSKGEDGQVCPFDGGGREEADGVAEPLGGVLGIYGDDSGREDEQDDGFEHVEQQKKHDKLMPEHFFGLVDGRHEVEGGDSGDNGQGRRDDRQDPQSVGLLPRKVVDVKDAHGVFKIEINFTIKYIQQVHGCSMR